MALAAAVVGLHLAGIRRILTKAAAHANAGRSAGLLALTATGRRIVDALLVRTWAWTAALTVSVE